MKTRTIPALGLASLLVIGCNQPTKTTSADGSNEPVLQDQLNQLDQTAAQLEQQIEKERLAMEREQLERDRAAFDEEKQKLADERAELERKMADADATERERLEAQAKSLDERERNLTARRATPVSTDYDEPATGGPVADYDTFYEDLSPHGEWFQTREYGYVWQPAAAHDRAWRPYTRGRWVHSDYGWTWASDEPFGWATYHYGRWAMIDGRGWIWVPGDTWGPAWVSWRESDDTLGWAPLPPETVYYDDTYTPAVETNYGISPISYVFISINNFNGPVWGHCYEPAQNIVIINRTVNITNIYRRDRYWHCGGPRYDRIHDRYRDFPNYRVDFDRSWAHDGRDRNRRDGSWRDRVENDRFRVYAPRVKADWNDELRPKNVRENWNDVKVVRADKGPSEDAIRKFRERRDERRQEGEKFINKSGGKEKFERERMETLLVNRKETLEKKRELVRDKSKVPAIPAVVTDQSATRPDGKPSDRRSPDVARGEERATEANKRREEAQARVKELQEQRERLSQERQNRRDGKAPVEHIDETGRVPRPPVDNAALQEQRERQNRRDGKPIEHVDETGRVPTRPAVGDPGRENATDRVRQLQEQQKQLQEERARLQQDRTRDQGERSRDQAADQMRQQQQEQADRMRQQQDRAREQAERARDQAADHAKQQQEQTERARQQQERVREQQERAREQAERARDQAADNARQEQAERARQQQQQERARQQQEEQQRARQEQQERAREQQERARQQQEEQQRARQEQMERAREQQERARQEQQERAREQQERAREQQERARQQQEEQQRARQEQQERARQQQQEQQERSRRQQEEQEDGRRRGR